MYLSDSVFEKVAFLGYKPGSIGKAAILAGKGLWRLGKKTARGLGLHVIPDTARQMGNVLDFVYRHPRGFIRFAAPAAVSAYSLPGQIRRNINNVYPENPYWLR